MSFLITNAVAAGSTGMGPSQGGTSSIIMIAVLVVAFYLLIIWPQNKRLKEHRNLVNNLVKDDEVITSGGILGKVTQVTDHFLTVLIAPNVEISVQKSSVTASVPKGTLKFSEKI